MQRLCYLLLLLVCALWAPLSAVAENSTSAGGFTVHYNALSTATLTPEVARAYGIERSKYRGMLNVSVIKEQEGTTGTAVSARVTAEIKALTGQNAGIPMREIKAGSAIYSIGTFSIQDEKTIDFVIEVTPEGTSETFVVNMEQQFFTD
ncbi:MAG: DUF4426 domain-containing protein [Candidatus Thiosymbion ectosymbiont of Robbea hypermnestra]|nr:DUF4426 domain-containing protein [Candidatus Thiosymbion ectosymbiont of Robbea hypermnestra]